jgi:hypothetical protein
MHTIKENAGAMVVANKEIGLEVNADKTMYMVMCRDQNARQSHSIKIETYKTVILHVLYGCETWSLTLRE